MHRDLSESEGSMSQHDGSIKGSKADERHEGLSGAGGPNKWHESLIRGLEADKRHEGLIYGMGA